MRQGATTFPVLLGGVSTALLGGYAYCVWQGLLPLRPLALAYAAMSLITIAVYHHDKSAARAGARRIPEASLHLLELLGGWPGALLAQLFFWHKVKKLSYQLVFWIIVIAHCAAFFVLHMEGAGLGALQLPAANLNLHLPEIPKLDLSFLFSPSPTNRSDETMEQSQEKPPEPSLDELWAAAPATEPLIQGPRIRRSKVTPHQQSRRLIGEVKAVSPAHGLLVALPTEIGGDGVIAPTTLVPDFYRRFQTGEQVVVAINGIAMKGTRKQVNLFLVEP